MIPTKNRFSRLSEGRSSRATRPAVSPRTFGAGESENVAGRAALGGRRSREVSGLGNARARRRVAEQNGLVGRDRTGSGNGRDRSALGGDSDGLRSFGSPERGNLRACSGAAPAVFG